MTHNTREVEEFYKKIDDYYRENFDESQPRKKMYITELIHHQLQKARQDWLREEIVKLQEHRNVDYTSAFNSIIDRYQAELDQDKV